jgi:hypothetical protein
MDWNIDDQGYPTQIVESKHLLDLKYWMKNKNCKCKVHITRCSPFFWMTKQEEELISSKGGVGWRGHSIGNPKPIVETKYIMITMTFQMSAKNAEIIKNTKLECTPNNRGEYLTTWKINPVTETISCTCGVYKRDGFDQAFNSMKILKPELTEKDFAKNGYGDHDNDLVECRLFGGFDKCIDTYTKHENVETSKCLVSMSLLEIDIEKNMEFIKTLLSAYC